MTRSTLLLACISALAGANALAAGPGQAGGPGQPLGEQAERCPPGWLLQGKVKATGAFTCRQAKSKGPAATSAAEPPLPCPVNTSYFIKGRQQGCAALPVAKHSAKRKTS